jgi:hypothetical protein
MRTYSHMSGIMASLLLMAVGSLWSNEIFSTDAPIRIARTAAISQPRIAPKSPGVTLDLRPPDLQVIQARHTPEATRPADAQEASNVTIVGTLAREESA